jgi:transcriptional regulator with XRE-family HTH domain
MKRKNYLNKEYKLKIGSNIRKWRNLKGIKQKELAMAMELSEAAISNIENNITDITLSQLEDISTGLNISVEQLFMDPQETYAVAALHPGFPERMAQPLIEKELLNAVIKSMQKKR